MKNRFILTPFFLDQPMPGLEHLVEPDWLINEPNLCNGSPQSRMGELYEPLAESVSKAAMGGERPVSLAGDCCTSLGVLAGLQRAGLDPFLIWFDAHGDFNTWETSPSGFLGGMPLAMLVGRGEQTIVDDLDLQPLSETSVLLIDGRDLDSGEQEALSGSQVTNLAEVMDILAYDLPEKPIWVHFDTDVIDASVAPGMNYPVFAGPGYNELEGVFAHLLNSRQVAAVSFSSWNPELDLDGRTEAICMALLGVLIGSQPGND